MARPKSDAPRIQAHISGQSVVRIDGQDYYLGKHGSPESHARYAVLLSEYQKNGCRLPDGFDSRELAERANAVFGPQTKIVETHQAEKPLQVKHLAESYRIFIAKRYAESQSELHRLNQVCDELKEFDGELLIADYGPRALQRQRQRWIDAGLARVYVNRLVNCTRRMFRWGVAEELVTESIWTRLRSVDALRCGQTDAPETEAVTPVAIDAVRKTSVELSPVLKSMLIVHVATGMRPSELCRMRPSDIDRTRPVWMYRPVKHKTANKGKARAIPIVGDARAEITNYLNRDPNSFCFSPKESMAWWQAKRRANRKSKVQPSQLDRSKENPRKEPGDCFDSNSYRQSIQRAALRAGVESWHPYQLRHLAATTVRDALGPEAAQALLGHSHISMTEHYAKVSERKAIEAAQHAPSLSVKGLDNELPYP